MKKPIICFDLDGTLLDPQEIIHPKDREILANNHNDVIFLPCTGRPRDSVISMFHHNGLFLNSAAPYAMVTQNGVATHLSDGRLAQYTTFPEEVQETLFDIFWDYPRSSFMLMKEDGNLLLWPNEFGSHWMARFHAPWEPFTPQDRKARFGKMTCLTDDEIVIHELTERLLNVPVEYGRSLKTVFDIQPQGVSKRSGVQHLMNCLGLEGSPVVAAGDGDNDLDLFEFADYSFAPSTTTASVQKQADQIIEVRENGLLTAMLDKANRL